MELAYIARAIRRYWWVVVAGALIGALSGYFFESGGSAEYRATSILLLSAGSESGGERYVQNEFVILGSSAVAERAASDLGGVTPSQVSDGITLQRIPESDLVRITATAASPPSAQSLANAYADAYIALATGLADAGGADVDTLNGAIEELEDRLAVVDNEIAEEMAPFLVDSAGIVVPDIEQVAPTLATARSVLLGQYSQLLSDRNELELGGEERLGSRVTEYASGSTIAAGAGSKLVVVVGITAGLMISTLGAVVISRLSGVVLDADEAASTLRAPVVATIPNVSSLRRHPLLPGDPLPRALKKTIRELAVQAETSVPSTETGRGALVVLVAGAERFSGATTIAVALASYFAEKGSQVLLVDADVPHPRLSAALGDDASAVGVLLDASGQSQSQSQSGGASPIRIAAPGVRFAGLGERHTRRSLSRQDVDGLLAGAVQHAQVVVIDGGVLMASASSVEFARRVDAVILTMPAQHQTRAGLDGAARSLASRSGGLLPVVTAARRRTRHGTTFRSVAVRQGEAENDPIERGEAADDPVEHGGAENEPIEHGGAENEPIEHGEAENEPIEHGEAENEPIEKSSVMTEQVATSRGRAKQRSRRAGSAASTRGTSRGT